MSNTHSQTIIAHICWCLRTLSNDTMPDNAKSNTKGFIQQALQQATQVWLPCCVWYTVWQGVVPLAA